MNTLLHKWLAPIWFLILGVACANTIAPPTLVYDGQNQRQTSCDASRNGPVFGYDGGPMLTANAKNKPSITVRALFREFDGFLAAEGTAPNLMYHYTTASESSFANGLWEGTSVTDKLYTDAAQASQELGIPVPNKVIPIQNTGQFVPNAPSIVEPSPLRGWSGGGTDFINPQRVPPSQLFPAQPIGPR